MNIKINNTSDRLTYEDYKKLCFELSDTLYKTNVNVNLYSLLELILLCYVEKINNESSANITLKNKDKEKINNNEILSEEKIIKINKDDNYYEKLEHVRINNCFIDASKKLKIENANNWEKFLSSIEDKKIKGLVEDTVVVLSSKKIIVLTSKIENMVNEINKNINVIEKKFNNMYNTNYELIATGIKNWDLQMEQFKNNISKNISYNYIEEPILSSNYEEVSDIFDISKIEEK